MVASGFGISKAENELRILCESTPEGTPIVGLEKGAIALGLKARVSLLTLDDINCDSHLVIAYLDYSILDSHYKNHAVLIQEVGTLVTFADPKEPGERVGLKKTLPREKFAEAWAALSGLALVIQRR